LEADGSSSITFRDGTTRPLFSENDARVLYEITASSGKAIAQRNGVNNAQEAMEISRLCFARSDITQAVSAQVAFERQYGGEEATDAAKRWVKTKTIPLKWDVSGSS